MLLKMKMFYLQKFISVPTLGDVINIYNRNHFFAGCIRLIIKNLPDKITTGIHDSENAFHLVFNKKRLHELLANPGALGEITLRITVNRKI